MEVTLLTERVGRGKHDGRLYYHAPDGRWREICGWATEDMAAEIERRMREAGELPPKKRSAPERRGRPKGKLEPAAADG